VAGLRVSGLRPGSLLGAVGVENGDQIQQINGFDLTNPTSAFEAYSKLRSADKLSVTLVRGGKPMNIDLRIQ
jgi:general secretion pathway protein C